MKSYRNAQFRAAFARLPEDIQRRARAAYRLFRQDPYHSSLQFKQVHSTKPIYSARIGLSYRALGVRRDDLIVWFWIGTHAEYDKILSQL